MLYRLIAAIEKAIDEWDEQRDLRRIRIVHARTTTHWRPALLDGKPARHCEFCEITEIITVEEFYGLFGRMPTVPLNTTPNQTR